MALGLVLVASMRSNPRFHLARVMRTTSVCGGPVAGITVMVPVRVTPKAVPVTVTVVATLTALVRRRCRGRNHEVGREGQIGQDARSGATAAGATPSNTSNPAVK